MTTSVRVYSYVHQTSTILMLRVWKEKESLDHLGGCGNSTVYFMLTDTTEQKPVSQHTFTNKDSTLTAKRSQVEEFPPLYCSNQCSLWVRSMGSNELSEGSKCMLYETNYSPGPCCLHRPSREWWLVLLLSSRLNQYSSHVSTLKSVKDPWLM